MAFHSKILSFVALGGCLILSGLAAADTSGTLGTPYNPTVTEILATPVKPIPATAPPAAAAVPAVVPSSQPAEFDPCAKQKPYPEMYALCISKVQAAAAPAAAPEKPATSSDPCEGFKNTNVYPICQDRMRKIEAVIQARLQRNQKANPAPVTPRTMPDASLAFDPSKGVPETAATAAVTPETGTGSAATSTPAVVYPGNTGDGARSK